MGQNKKIKKSLATREKTLEKHHYELEKAIEGNDEYLTEYYKKEIGALEEAKIKVLQKLSKKAKFKSY